MPLRALQFLTITVADLPHGATYYYVNDERTLVISSRLSRPEIAACVLEVLDSLALRNAKVPAQRVSESLERALTRSGAEVPVDVHGGTNVLVPEDGGNRV